MHRRESLLLRRTKRRFFVRFFRAGRWTGAGPKSAPHWQNRIPCCFCRDRERHQHVFNSIPSRFRSPPFLQKVSQRRRNAFYIARTRRKQVGNRRKTTFFIKKLSRWQVSETDVKPRVPSLNFQFPAFEKSALNHVHIPV